MAASSIRARVRAEMLDEIKVVARRHLASDGANLSLRAVARDMGMVSSAIYRYFPSRDDLLTALIIDAYDALGAVVEAADAGADRLDLRGRWHAACRAARDWALAHPAEYALLYGSPVPGYAAPDDTVGPAQRPPATLIGILHDGMAAGRLAAPTRESCPNRSGRTSRRSPTASPRAACGVARPGDGRLDPALRADQLRAVRPDQPRTTAPRRVLRPPDRPDGRPHRPPR